MLEDLAPHVSENDVRFLHQSFQHQDDATPLA